MILKTILLTSCIIIAQCTKYFIDVIKYEFKIFATIDYQLDSVIDEITQTYDNIITIYNIFANNIKSINKNIKKITL